MEDWLQNKAESILREVGIAEGHILIDFGIGSGIYSILCSKIIGMQGKVYAIDIDQEKIEELNRKISEQHLNNIKMIKISEKIILPIKKDEVNTVLIYDVFHLLTKEQKFDLIHETKRVLKSNGLVSFHVTHRSPNDKELHQIHEIVIKDGFVSKSTLKRPMFHWSWIEEGLIVNYLKI